MRRMVRPRRSRGSPRFRSIIGHPDFGQCRRPFPHMGWDRWVSRRWVPRQRAPVPVGGSGGPRAPRPCCVHRGASPCPSGRPSVPVPPRAPHRLQLRNEVSAEGVFIPTSRWRGVGPAALFPWLGILAPAALPLRAIHRIQDPSRSRDHRLRPLSPGRPPSPRPCGPPPPPPPPSPDPRAPPPPPERAARPPTPAPLGPVQPRRPRGAPPRPSPTGSTPPGATQVPRTLSRQSGALVVRAGSSDVGRTVANATGNGPQFVIGGDHQSSDQFWASRY